MSSESSDETFEQHRKLRTRAEDYVHKPIAFGDLLARIQQFVRIATPQSEGQIVIEDEISLSSMEMEDEGDADRPSASDVRRSRAASPLAAGPHRSGHRCLRRRCVRHAPGEQRGAEHGAGERPRAGPEREARSVRAPGRASADPEDAQRFGDSAP